MFFFCSFWHFAVNDTAGIWTAASASVEVVRPLSPAVLRSIFRPCRIQVLWFRPRRVLEEPTNPRLSRLSGA